MCNVYIMYFKYVRPIIQLNREEIYLINLHNIFTQLYVIACKKIIFNLIIYNKFSVILLIIFNQTFLNLLVHFFRVNLNF